MIGRVTDYFRALFDRVTNVSCLWAISNYCNSRVTTLLRSPEKKKKTTTTTMPDRRLGDEVSFFACFCLAYIASTSPPGKPRAFDRIPYPGSGDFEPAFSLGLAEYNSCVGFCCFW